MIRHMRFFFFNDTATTEIYTLSLHDALPIWHVGSGDGQKVGRTFVRTSVGRSIIYISGAGGSRARAHDDLEGCRRTERSEEHTSELQSRQYLVCRLLLEKKTKATIVPVAYPV